MYIWTDMTPWNDYRYEEFEFCGRKAAVVFPEKPDEKRRWGIFTEYFGLFPGVALALLNKGYHIAGLVNRTRWGTDDDQDMRRDFADFLEEKYRLSHKCVLIGMSCGGLHAIKFASAHPNRVSVLYLDAPVVNLLSSPMGYGVGDGSIMGISECLNAYNLSPSQLLGFRDHPQDRIPKLIENRIPVLLVYGDADTTVPYQENGIYVEKAYVEANSEIKVIRKPGVPHHPHGLENPAPIIEYILAHDN